MHVRDATDGLSVHSRSDTFSFSFIHLFCFPSPPRIYHSLASRVRERERRSTVEGVRTFNSFSSLFETRENNNSRRETEGQTQFWRILSLLPRKEKKTGLARVERKGKRQQAGKAIEPSFPVFQNRALMRSPIKKAYQRRGRRDADDRIRMEN